MKKETFWVALKTTQDRWDECQQITFTGTVPEMILACQFAANLTRSKVRMSRSEGFNNQGSYFDPEFIGNQTAVTVTKIR